MNFGKIISLFIVNAFHLGSTTTFPDNCGMKEGHLAMVQRDIAFNGELRGHLYHSDTLSSTEKLCCVVKKLPQDSVKKVVSIKLPWRSKEVVEVPDCLRVFTSIERFCCGLNVNIKKFPDWISQLPIKELYAEKTSIESLPDFNHPDLIEKLLIDDTQISSLPESVKNMTNLKVLWARNTPISSLPKGLNYLSKITYLSLEGTRIQNLPEAIGNNPIQQLSIGFTQISRLPSKLAYPGSLISLSFPGTAVKKIPSWIEKAKNLKYLNARGSHLKELPPEITSILPLSGAIDLRNTALVSLPEGAEKSLLTKMKAMAFIDDELDTLLSLKGTKKKVDKST